MSKRKVLVVFGTRPEAVKLAPVITALREHGEVRVCVTAQHRALLDQMLSVFAIEPDHDLDLMRPRQDIFDITRAALEGLRSVLATEKPDAVLVQGDTTSSFAAALAATYLRIPVAHVEAGLRTGDRAQPFPEEINRRLTSQLAQWHFAPTEAARENLLREGIAAETIAVTGNPVVDALHGLLARLQSGELAADLPPEVMPALAARRLLLVTAHRRESFGDGLARICAAVSELAASHADAAVLFVTHPNPQAGVTAERLLAAAPGVYLCPPLEYVEFVDVMRRAHFILTDSGGVQEEAPSLGRPVLVLREKTERPEGLAAGVAKLVGTDRARIVAEASRLLNDDSAHDAMRSSANPYGDGQAARRIAEFLAASL